MNARVVRSRSNKAYVPDLSVAEAYVSRKVKGVRDINLLDYARDNALNVLLQGDTGSGKTMLGAAYAAVGEYNYYSLPCDVSIDPTSLFGKMVMSDRAGEFEWVDGPVTQLVREGGVLNISEVNFMPPKIAASLYPLLDARRHVSLLGHKGEIVRAHHPEAGQMGACWCSLSARECKKKWLLVIADMNPNYRGTLELNAAFKNRFPLTVNWGYDSRVEEKLVQVPKLLEVAGMIRGKKDDIVTPASTNMLLEFIRFSRDLGYPFAVENFVTTFDADERGSVQNIFDIARVELERQVMGLADEDAVEDDTPFDYEEDPVPGRL